jgi:ubiquinone/menaquinone biosynthesis C-methylase UbiE
MASRTRQRLEEGPILDPLFVEHYWRFSRRPMQWAARWVAVKMRKLAIPATARVLDIGCGPGWLAWFLSGRFPAMRFYALDASEPMIVRAKEGSGDKSICPAVHFLVGDGCRLPFGSEQFDLIISGATLHHVGNPVAFFDEIGRVLTASGHVIISDVNRGIPRLLWPLVKAADWIERRLRPMAARQLSEGFAASFEAAYDADEIRRFLSQSMLGKRVHHYPRAFQHWIQTAPRSFRKS